jgi:hypothetical protein
MDVPTITPGAECCRKMEFRKVVTQQRVDGPSRPCVSTRTRCVVCFNNHYLMEVPPIEFGINGSHA